MVKILPKGASSEIFKDKYDLTLLDIAQWLRLKNVINAKNCLVEYEDIREWVRSGDETYIAVFRIKYLSDSKENNKLVILKALVSFDPEKRLQDWASRRLLLAENHVPVSNWYWFGSGIIIEDFYPSDYLSCNNFPDLVLIAVKLDQLGFHALNFLLDLRCDYDGNPYYLDFGSDLGAPSAAKKDTAIRKLFDTYTDRHTEISELISKMENNYGNK